MSNMIMIGNVIFLDMYKNNIRLFGPVYMKQTKL